MGNHQIFVALLIPCQVSMPQICGFQFHRLRPAKTRPPFCRLCRVIWVGRTGADGANQQRPMVTQAVGQAVEKGCPGIALWDTVGQAEMLSQTMPP